MPLVRVTSDDPDFLDGLNNLVAVEVDVNRAGGTTSGMAGAAPNYQPDPDYDPAEPCRLVDKAAKPAGGLDQRPTAQVVGRALFGRTVELDLNHRLVRLDRTTRQPALDPQTGKPRYLYVTARSRNAHDMDHHWVVDYTEVIA